MQAKSLKQLMRRGDGEEAGGMYQETPNLINTQQKDKVREVLDFGVQQATVNLVVDVRIILLLAQV